MKKNYEMFANFIRNELDDNNIIDIRRGIAMADGSVIELFEMYELDEICYGMTLSEFLEKKDDNFNHNDNYFYWDWYGDICSTDDPYEDLDIDEMIDLLWDNWDKYEGEFYCQELKDFYEELIEGDE